MFRYSLATLALALSVSLVHAQEPAPSEVALAQDSVLDTAVVHAPGPGMWQVRRGDHTLWILGTVSPLPAGMAWNSTKVRAVVMQADEVIGAPSVTVDADIGFFGKLAWLPSLIGVRANPDGKSLRQVVPAPTYTRWLRLKQQYLGRDDSPEGWRPIFAGMKLYSAAIEHERLSSRGVVHEQLEGAMKSRGLKPVDVSAKTKVANPREVVREFKSTSFSDAECFSRTLDRVEFDLGTLAARANAWAAGDIKSLEVLRNPTASDICERAMLGGQFAAKYGMDTLEAKSQQKWIAEAQASLARNRVTFAVLPMHDVLSADGLVAALARKGYEVVAPSPVAIEAPARPLQAR